MKFSKYLLLLFVGAILWSCDEDEDVAVETGIVSFSQAELLEVENATIPLAVAIGINQPNHSGGTVTVTIEGGVYGDDYTTSEGASSFDVVFDANSLLNNFSFQPIDDEDIETPQSFTVTLSNATGGLELGEITSLEIKILDDDDPLIALVSFEEATYTQPEESLETLAIPITLTKQTTNGGTITIEATGDAVAGTDYLINGQPDATFTIEVPAGATASGFDFVTIDDDIFAADVNAIFTITEVTGGLSIGKVFETTVTITNDDESINPVIDFDPSNPVSVNEDGGSITLNFIISEATTAEATVSLTASGTANIGEDYTIDGSGTSPYDLVVPAGATTASIEVAITDDADVEDDELLQLEITAVTGGLEPGVGAQVNSVTIVDNDSSDVPIDYLETFESFDGTPEYLADVLMYQTALVTQSPNIDRLFNLIENAGSFSDPVDPTLPSDTGLNLFYNNQGDSANNGVLDNVVITSPLDGAGTIDVTIDGAYAFKNQNTALVTFYWSETYDGSGTFNEGDWNVMGTEDVATMDGEGFGNNDYKRQQFTINPTTTFYIAIRVNQTIDDTNFRTRWRFDNITAVSQ